MNEVKKPRKPLLFYSLIVLLVILLFNTLVMPMITKSRITEVDYGTFIKMAENKEIGIVEIDDKQILFTDKDKKVVYSTGVMEEDADLVLRLYESGA